MGWSGNALYFLKTLVSPIPIFGVEILLKAGVWQSRHFFENISHHQTEIEISGEKNVKHLLCKPEAQTTYMFLQKKRRKKEIAYKKQVRTKLYFVQNFGFNVSIISAITGSILTNL